jgi:hypothetical protein
VGFGDGQKFPPQRQVLDDSLVEGGQVLPGERFPLLLLRVMTRRRERGKAIHFMKFISSDLRYA